MLKVLFWFMIFFWGFSVFAQDPISIKGEIYVKIKTIHIPKIKTTLINGKETLELPGVKAILKNKNKLQAIKLTKVKDSRSGLQVFG